MVSAVCNYFDDREVCVAQWDQRQWGKDISEVYQHHGAEAARRMVDGALPILTDDIEDFRSDTHRAEVIQAAMGQFDHGYDAGMGPITNRHFRLNSQGGIIIVTGVPNTGKTDFLNYLTMSLVRQRGSHVCFCSFETPDKMRHAGDLTQLWAGATDLSTMTEEDVRPFANHVMNHITHIRMRRERPSPEAVLHKAEKVMRRHPDLEFLVIDPYLYLSMPQGRNITETESVKTMLTQLQDWSHDHHVWTFIVAHPRKLQKDDGSRELEEIDMYTIAGSANWANVADFVISLKRVRRQESDYTCLSVLKVRDQKLCTPGIVYYNRQACGRYDERTDERQAMQGTGQQDLEPWMTEDGTN